MAIRQICVYLVIVALLAVVPCSAQDTTEKLDAEMLEFIKNYRQAFQEKDIDAVMSLYAPGQQAVLMGTGPGERYEGQEEIRAAHLEYFNSYDKEESKNTWHKIWVKGDIALVAVQTYITAYAKNVKEEFAINWSGAMEKQDGKWVFLSRHISNLSCEN